MAHQLNSRLSLDPEPRSPLYDPNSYSAKRLAKRTGQSMTPAQRKIRDDFVLFLVMGYSKAQAAHMTGTPLRSCSKRGSELFREPYVQQQMNLIRDKITEEELVSKKEVIAGLLKEARSEGEDSKQAARVSAWTQISKIMGFEKPMKIEADVHHKGGVMVVHAHGSIEDWENKAIDVQAVLREDARK